LGAIGESRAVLSSLGAVHKEVKAGDYRFSFMGRWLNFATFGLDFSLGFSSAFKTALNGFQK
jgi:hypothetical protein